MKLFVQVAFDINDAVREDYKKIEVLLSSLGLARFIEQPGGGPITLPANTFAGIRECFDSQSEAIDRILQEIRQSSFMDMYHGRVVVTASPESETKCVSTEF